MSSTATTTAPTILFCDRGCPFAHRVLALFEHLGHPFDRREVAVGSKPEGLEHYSASERLPLLVQGELVITESRVMLEHFAEHYGFTNAYPRDLATRTLHRHAMAVVDDYLVPLLMKRITGDDRRLGDALAAIEAATATTRPLPCLLAIHLAPVWNAFRAWYPDEATTRAIQARPSLRRWLDKALALDCIARTAPDPAVIERDLNRARAAGLLPNTVCVLPRQQG